MTSNRIQQMDSVIGCLLKEFHYHISYRPIWMTEVGNSVIFTGHNVVKITYESILN